MPSVAVLPPSFPKLGFESYGQGSHIRQSDTLRINHTPNSDMPNGSVVASENLSISEIKEKAKEDARKHAKGISAISLLKSARTQSQIAQANENEGNLKGALSALLKAGSLAAMVLNSSEFVAESKPGKHGVLFKEFVNFQKHDGNNLKQRVEAIESKLSDLEKHAAIELSDAASKPAGNSIADRLKSLHDAGLPVGTAKRVSREVPVMSSTSTIFKSPEPMQARPPSTSIRSPPQPLQLSISPTAPTSNSAGSSPHVVVLPSTLGPPSPVSSDSSSPRIPRPSLSEFSQTFLPIDELNELDPSRFPSVPGTLHGTITNPGSTLPHTDDVDSTMPLHLKSFPALSIDPGPRSSSTPVTPTLNTFISRPASPAIASKPSINSFASFISSKPPPVTGKPLILITNGVTPAQLHEYMYQRGLKVLLVDVRTREEFDADHIKADAVVNLEPYVLTRASTSAANIEDFIALGEERVLFQNRDKFDRVVLYDASSETYDIAGPLSSFVRIVYEMAFTIMLRSPPMLLIGGLQAWKKFNEGEATAGDPSGQRQSQGSVLENGTTGGLIPPLSLTSSTPDTSQRQLTPINGVTSADRMSPERRPFDLSQLSRFPDKGVDNGAIPEELTSMVQGSPSPQQLSFVVPHGHSPLETTPHASRAMSQSIVHNTTDPISYPSFPPSAASSSTSSFSSPSSFAAVSIPPQASLSPSRRRNEYMDGPQSPASGFTPRSVITYPELPLSTLRPPPPAASVSSERQDSRPRLMHSSSSSMSVMPLAKTAPKPPTIASDYPVLYWPDVQINTAGLKNLGNTCYMNATIQCLHATVPFTRFFTDGRWKPAVNMLNPLGTKGSLAQAFASILYDMSHSELPHLNPLNFRKSICYHAAQFGGSDQHDSQEFLTFLLDGLHEDLNRVLTKLPNCESTPKREAELEKLPQQIASQQEWKIYKIRNDSLIVDYFQGQFRNRMECLTCHRTSTTYNSFMYLSLPIPSVKSPAKVSLFSCLDAFVREEVLEKAEAWYCPECKQLRRATKKLTLSRLPPVLLIHLKRFSVKGPFTDKIETVVDFPLRGLDLTNYMPPPLPPGMQVPVDGVAPIASDDPQTQMPPFKYDLYAVTNHFGSLSNGHYTAFIASRGGWLYCDDSRITNTNASEVVGRPAYVLYYKRVRA